MKSYWIQLLLAVFCLNAHGQSTEFGVQLNTGFFRFSGESAESRGMINYNLDKEDGYTNNPYGNTYGLSYGVSVNVIRTTSSKVRIGIDFGYEVLRSRVDIDAVFQRSDGVSETVSATGKTMLNSSFLNLFPSLGYKISTSSFDLNIDGGFDLGFCLSATEDGSASTESRTYQTERDRKTITFDFRPRIQMGIQKNRIGGYLGYSRGLRSYRSGFSGGSNGAYSEMIRIGLLYKI